MKTIYTVIAFFVTALTFQSCITSELMEPPVAEKKPKELTIHGDTRIDPYYWLRERENPEVISYLEAENHYRESVMKGSRKLQDKLYEEIVGRIKQDDESVPYKDNGYYYYTRYEEGKEYPIHCRKKGSLEAEEEIIANVNEMSEGYDYYQLTGLSVSPDNRYIILGVDTVSRRKYSLYIKDLETGELLPDEIPLTAGDAAWASDNRTILYAQKDDTTLRLKAIFRHTLGSSVSEDVLVYEEKDDTYDTWVYTTKSKKYLVIGSASKMTTEYRFLSADDPTGEFQLIQPRIQGLEYSISHMGDYFYIVTNLDATNFRLMKTRVTSPGKSSWIEVIPHREDVFIESIELFKKYLVVEERREGLIQIRAVRWDTGEEHYIDMEEEVYTAYVSTNMDFDSELLRFAYSSLTTPFTTYDYHLDTREKTLLKREEVLGGDFNPENYEGRRIHAMADDGKMIPISIVYRKGMELNGKNPTLLYGYGSYGITFDPTFSSQRLSLLDRGFVYAIAHVRGSQVNGRPWYEDGRLLNKKNTFTDFNDCAEYLIHEQYTSPEHLYAQGGSAGGLLMGAIINMQPELYHGVVASVPFVDVVTTMLDEEIPLTTAEYEEWGNPNDKIYYDYMLSYSPYDQVEAKDYPNILVTTGLHDSQVQYWEPAKWVAKLRDLKTDHNMLVMYCNMEAGHGGASGRFERYKETALVYAFLFQLEGIKE